MSETELAKHMVETELPSDRFLSAQNPWQSLMMSAARLARFCSRRRNADDARCVELLAAATVPVEGNSNQCPAFSTEPTFFDGDRCDTTDVSQVYTDLSGISLDLSTGLFSGSLYHNGCTMVPSSARGTTKACYEVAVGASPTTTATAASRLGQNGVARAGSGLIYSMFEAGFGEQHSTCSISPSPGSCPAG